MINYNVEFTKPQKDFPESYEKYKKMKIKLPEAPTDINEIYDKCVENYVKESKEGMKPLGYLWQNQLIPRNDPKYGGTCLKATTPFDRLFRQATTPLSRDYFSDDTVKFIQHYISASLKEKYDLPLGLQPKNGIIEYMIKLYNDLSCELPDAVGYGSRSFTILLNYTLQEIENKIYRNFVNHTSYLNYLETGGITSVPVPKLAKKPNYAIQLKKVPNGYYGPKTSAGFFSKYNK